MFEKEAQNGLSAVTVVTPLCLFAVYSCQISKNSAFAIGQGSQRFMGLTQRSK